ncbi:uncharacterized protein [Epargyreus clarus]|uniref:uncharacterized protein n=1 Tax=Epargyreus clarus TaxID=520877 RepID=UPI003C2FC808
MVISCCVKGCTSEKYPGCNLNFYSFPTDEKTRNKWIKVTKPFKTEYDSNMTIKSCDKMALDIEVDNHINNDDYSHSADSEDDYEQDIDDDEDNVQTENNKNSVVLGNNPRCKCCLENDKLKSMWQEYCCDGKKEVYGNMLVECFALTWVKPPEPVCMTEYICALCVRRLRDALSFRTELLAAQQLLSTEAQSLEYDKLKQECDEVEEIQTEYLNLEYLEDDNDNQIDNIDNQCDDSDSDKYNDSVDKELDDEEIVKDNVITVKIECLQDKSIQEEGTKEVSSRRKRTIPKKYKQYTADDLQRAVDVVVNRQMSQNSASRRYKVPVRVLASAVKNHIPLKTEPVTNKTEAQNIKSASKRTKLYPEQNLWKAVDDVWNRTLTQTQASKHYNVPRSTIFGMLIKKYGRSTKPQPGEEQPVKKKPLEGSLEMVKHTTNINAIMENSNATPIRCHGDGGYLCCFCDHQYQKPEDLKTHTITKHDMKTKKNFTKGKRPSSYFVKLDISFLKCNVCESNIDSLESLLNHFVNKHNIRVHTDIKNHILPFKFESDELRCSICYNVFNNFKVLQTHLNNHYPNYVCTVCNAGFVSSMILHSHSRGHVTGYFKCEQCSKVYTTQRQLRCHQNLVHKQAYMASKCGYCYERFKSYHRKIEHLIKVHNVKPLTFVCNACDRNFNSQSALRIHRKRDHLMERKYACTECDMKFFARDMLDAHMLKHTGVRNFQCDVCNKCYKRRHTLREHMRIHANDRRFKCVQCGAAFVQKCSWRAHMRSKHGVII